ncbi:unannotated protein [freshwater metagenome]|uniref:Unannotated protein n=1 Tax=freshwater metagenome TaxID=449393 RepID=A0A6J7AAT6_9ZZZZ
MKTIYRITVEEGIPQIRSLFGIRLMYQKWKTILVATTETPVQLGPNSMLLGTSNES